MIQVYHGPGKGKTSAAVGAAVRAAGRNLTVLFVQFMKDAADPSGEVLALQEFAPRIEVRRAPLPCSIVSPPDRPSLDAMRRATAGLLDRAIDEAASGRWRMIVMDEAGIALSRGWLARGRFEDLLSALPKGTELIVTGRRMPRWLTDRADLVTRFVSARHPYDRGVAARRGIEF